MKPRTIIIAITSLAIIAFALALGNALGGGSINLFSPTYTVEADNAGDSPQVIINGRSNDAVVTLAPLPVVEPRNRGGYVLCLAVFMAAALLTAWRIGTVGEAPYGIYN